MSTVEDSPTIADARAAVALAIRAPSIHNTQPWRWVFTGESLELRADHERQLAAIDPEGRALLISCGGALYLACLALAARGWEVVVGRLPEPTDRDLLARIRFAGRRPVEERTQALAAAAERRHTERRPFRAEPVPEPVLDELRRAVERDGVYAHLVTHAEQRLDLAVVISWADEQENRDEQYRAELARWVRTDPDAEEGVPSSAVPHVPVAQPRHTDVPLRDFELGGRGGQEYAGGVDEQPVFVVLFTAVDDADARLRAGEAYVRLSVEAERLGLASSALTQAVDLPGIRERVRALMDWIDHPQMVLRVGWAPEGAPPPATPRRGVDAVLTVQPAPLPPHPAPS